LTVWSHQKDDHCSPVCEFVCISQSLTKIPVISLCIHSPEKVLPMSFRPNSAVLIAIADAGKVRLGAFAPTLATADTGKVRLGAFAPTLATADEGKVRLDTLMPTPTTSR